MSRYTNPIPQYFLENGDFASGGLLYFYEFNTDTLLTIYADEAETITIPNPVTLGSRGEVPNIFFSVSARVRLTDSEGVDIFDVQPVALAGGGSGGVSGWSSSSAYSQLNIVFASDNEFYISLVDENIGNDPTSDTDNSEFWTRLDFLRFWNSQDTFAANQIVVRGSKLYASTSDDNTSNDPQTDSTNWTDISSALVSPYDNSVSGLTSTNVNNAIDELNLLISYIQSAVVYRGNLDVSAGDSALPASPLGGDLYTISTGGSITISVNNATPVLTAVSQGQQIIFNADTNAWDLAYSTSQAAFVSFNNIASGLSSTDVQGAIDEIDAQVDTNTEQISTLNSIVEGIGDGITFKGQLDVSAGDSALPVAPKSGDLYLIAVGGTITVSVNGAAPQPAFVAVGQQIVYSGSSVRWDLLASVTQAVEITYSNTTSGLAANNVQFAIDEVNTKIDDELANSYLSSDLDTTKTSGFMRFDDNVEVQFGSDSDAILKFDGTDVNYDQTNGDLNVTVDGQIDVDATNGVKITGGITNSADHDYVDEQVLQNPATGTYTRTAKHMRFNSWLTTDRTYTLDESTFETGDKVTFNKAYTGGVMTLITSSGVFNVDDSLSDSEVTLSKVATVTCEKIDTTNWLVVIN